MATAARVPIGRLHEPASAPRTRSLWSDALHRLLRNRLSVAGAWSRPICTRAAVAMLELLVVSAA
jgi:hypothetical protein